MHRDFEMRFLAAFGLALIDGEHAVMDVMRAHLDHIAAALAGVEDQREGKPRLGADRMRRLECRDLGLGPTLVSGGLHLHALDAERRIVGHAAVADRPLEHRAQRLEQVVLCEWCRCFLVDDALHVLARQQHDAAVAFGAVERLVTVRPAEGFERAAAGALRLFAERLERRATRRIEIRRNQSVDGPGNRALGADVGWLRHAFERRRMLAHEIFGPRDAGEIARDATLAEANAPRAVAVAIPRAMLRKAASCPQHWSKLRPRDCCLAPPASLRGLPDRRPGMSCRPWRRSLARQASCRRRARS